MHRTGGSLGTRLIEMTYPKNDIQPCFKMATSLVHLDSTSHSQLVVYYLILLPVSTTVAHITSGPLHDSKKDQTPYCKLASKSGYEVLASSNILFPLMTVALPRYSNSHPLGVPDSYHIISGIN